MWVGKSLKGLCAEAAFTCAGKAALELTLGTALVCDGHQQELYCKPISSS